MTKLIVFCIFSSFFLQISLRFTNICDYVGSAATLFRSLSSWRTINERFVFFSLSSLQRISILKSQNTKTKGCIHCAPKRHCKHVAGGRRKSLPSWRFFSLFPTFCHVKSRSQITIFSCLQRVELKVFWFFRFMALPGTFHITQVAHI
jgi:hypothetical protein